MSLFLGKLETVFQRNITNKYSPRKYSPAQQIQKDNHSWQGKTYTYYQQNRFKQKKQKQVKNNNGKDVKKQAPPI